MAAVNETNTEEPDQLGNKIRRLQQMNILCDFILITNTTSIECHKLVLACSSTYFLKLFSNPEHNINTIDVSHVSSYTLKSVVDFMYENEYVIDDENVFELLKLSENWNLDNLSVLCEKYANNITITIDNTCRLYNSALDNVGQQKLQHMNEFIRGNFTKLHELKHLNELSLKNFTNLIEHDEINVKTEDVIFHSAVQIIDQCTSQTSVEDINRCLKLIRFRHISTDHLAEFIHSHPLMKELPRVRFVVDALKYHSSKSIPRYWQRKIYYIGYNQNLYELDDDECKMVMELPTWVDGCSSLARQNQQLAIVPSIQHSVVTAKALLVDLCTTDPIKTELAELDKSSCMTGVALTEWGLYVIGNYKNKCDSLPQSYYPFSSNYVYCIGQSDEKWVTKSPMPYPVQWSLVIPYHQCIYVLGGFDKNTAQESFVQQYNIADDTWIECQKMPISCDSKEAGVVVHQDIIKVITVDRCLTYDADADTWSSKSFDKLGKAINAFIRKGQIWAVVDNSDLHSILSYDDVNNVWETESEGMNHTFRTRLFC